MANFYKISPAQAQTLTAFEYSAGKMFDPFVNEQTDGTFLVSEAMYELLKSHPKFVLLNWAGIAKIPFSQIDSKAV